MNLIFLSKIPPKYFAKTGLKKTSVVRTGKIAVIHNSTVKKTLVSLPEGVFKLIKAKLKKTLELE